MHFGTAYGILALFLGLLGPTLVLTAGAAICRSFLSLLGQYLRRKTKSKRQSLRVVVDLEEAQQGVKIHPSAGNEASDWNGFIGFFHPFCNAAGGGERVLWIAIKATQKRYPRAICVVYTGGGDIIAPETDRGSTRTRKDTILERAEANFNITLHKPSIHFHFLSTRDWVLASRYPYFTLLGQSLGSLRVAYDAFSGFVPDVFIDTMGYSFVTALAKFLFPFMPTGAYVHYPTISTDMLSSLDDNSGKGLNAGTGRGWKGYLKKQYWLLFAQLYGWTGGLNDVVMTNSSWTQSHIQSLWGSRRSRVGRTSPIEVVFPPVSVDEIENAIEVSEASERSRERTILYIAQFRPEKNHELVIEAFAKLLQLIVGQKGKSFEDAKLVLIGSLRDDDNADKKRVNHLRELVREHEIEGRVQFLCNAPWKQMLDWLGRSSIGVNAMWNEHFGIGVVEYQAAGLICVVNDSGGPKEDIVVDIEGGPTGFHANTASEYAAAFSKVLTLSPEEALVIRRRARVSAKRFSEESFSISWTAQLDKLVSSQIGVRSPETENNT